MWSQKKNIVKSLPSFPRTSQCFCYSDRVCLKTIYQRSSGDQGPQPGSLQHVSPVCTRCQLALWDVPEGVWALLWRRRGDVQLSKLIEYINKETKSLQFGTLWLKRARGDIEQLGCESENIVLKSSSNLLCFMCFFNTESKQQPHLGCWIWSGKQRMKQKSWNNYWPVPKNPHFPT